MPNEKVPATNIQALYRINFSALRRASQDGPSAENLARNSNFKLTEADLAPPLGEIMRIDAAEIKRDPRGSAQKVAAKLKERNQSGSIEKFKDEYLPALERSVKAVLKIDLDRDGWITHEELYREYVRQNTTNEGELKKILDFYEATKSDYRGFDDFYSNLMQGSDFDSEKLRIFGVGALLKSMHIYKLVQEVQSLETTYWQIQLFSALDCLNGELSSCVNLTGSLGKMFSPS